MQWDEVRIASHAVCWPQPVVEFEAIAADVMSHVHLPEALWTLVLAYADPIVELAAPFLEPNGLSQVASV